MTFYKNIKKCITVGCDNNFEGAGFFCEECTEKNNKLKSNNPKGYNKYKKNPKPIKKETEVITQETVKEAYRELWMAKRNLLSKAQKFARLNKMFCGLDQVDKELKELG